MRETLRVCSVRVNDEHFRRVHIALVYVSNKDDLCAVRRPTRAAVFRRCVVCESASAGSIIVHDIQIAINTEDDFRSNVRRNAERQEAASEEHEGL